MLFVLSCVLLLLSLAGGEDEAIFASMQQQQNLATRIRCQVSESEHFEYVSDVELWESMGGKISIQADILLHCLGADEHGRFGSDALKYNVQISHLRMVEGGGHDIDRKKSRKKRGAKEFFQKSWNKVKKFFNKIFGRNVPPPEETTRSLHDSNPDTQEVPEDLSPLYSTPFQLLQLADGSIPEIRFSENEVEDERVRNFKRHLADAFSTHLDLRIPAERTEQSVLGQHTTHYNISYVAEDEMAVKVAGLTRQPEKESLVSVHKYVSEDDVLSFAPTAAPNDKQQMELESRQTQFFRDGHMISSRGSSSLQLVAEKVQRRKKRSSSSEEDATSYISTRTSFDIQLRRRRRRSAEEVDRLERHEASFKAADRQAQMDDGRREERDKVRSLQNSIEVETMLQQHLRDEEMVSLQELVEREVSLDVDSEENSVCGAVRRIFNLQKVEEMCGTNFTRCKDYLQLISLAGGSAIEKIFLSLLRNADGRLSTAQLHSVADVVSDIPRPSEPFIASLMSMVREGSPPLAGALAIALSNLAPKSAGGLQDKVPLLLADLLSKTYSCEDPFLIDVLEALGNVGSRPHLLPHVLKVSAQCKDSASVQIATAHALRHSCQLRSVREWMAEVLKEGGDCDLVKEVLSSLMDTIQDQEIKREWSSWPRSHFDSIDDLLEHRLQEGACAREDILLYFSKKTNTRANDIARSLFGPESEPWGTPDNSSRPKRRAPWDSVNCEEWTEDTRYTPIQSKEEFATDRSIYNKRKSCLAFRRLGVKGANAEIYAGMFAGVKDPSDPPKYKLFTKFVSGLNFLGNQVEIGSFYFYLHNGNTKAYVRIMGKTRQEFTHEGCTPTELRYRPLQHIPLYLVSVGNLQLSLGIHLSSSLAMDTDCPSDQVYQMKPLTNVRVGGEALGTVLFMRGSANLGANFNYKLQFTFSPWPDMCLKGSHGYEPMNINFQSYFQLWSRTKEEWGKLRMWKPNFLSWQIRKGSLKQWFDDTCIAHSVHIEREME